MRIGWIVAVLVAGCAGGGGGEAPHRVFDFGQAPPAARLPGLRVMPVRAAAPFDTGDMLYRLAYRNPDEVRAFAQSRWAAAPAVLLQRRFLRAAADGPGACALEFELAEMTQVFSSPGASEVVLEGRANLLAGSSRVAERTFRVRDADAGPDAAAGARAVARAADTLIGDLAAWSATVASCKGG